MALFVSDGVLVQNAARRCLIEFLDGNFECLFRVGFLAVRASRIKLLNVGLQLGFEHLVLKSFLFGYQNTFLC